MITFDQNNPLDRCQAETKAANAALRDYYRMGAGRSLRALLEAYRDQFSSDSLTTYPPTKRISTISTWSTRYSWQARVAQAEQLDRAQEKSLKQKALRESVQRWADRQMDVRERDWSQAEILRSFLDKVLAAGPDFIKRKTRFIKGKDGRPDKEIITESLDLKLLINGLTAASTLQRLAAEMETDHSLIESTTPEDLEEIRKRRWQAISEQLSEIVDEADDENEATQENLEEL